MNTAILVIPNDAPHLSAEDVAAFLDRSMTAVERASVEAHLADCPTCRGEVADVRRLLKARPTGRRIMLFPAGLAAAAAIAVIVVNLNRGGPESTIERVRTPPAAAPTESSQRIAVLSPAEGDTIRPGSPALLWSAVSGEPTYRLTMTDASGQPVWVTTTTDTSVTLPPQVALQSRTTYFWYVDALRADGRAASTGVRSFTTP